MDPASKNPPMLVTIPSATSSSLFTAQGGFVHRLHHAFGLPVSTLHTANCLFRDLPRPAYRGQTVSAPTPDNHALAAMRAVASHEARLFACFSALEHPQTDNPSKNAGIARGRIRWLLSQRLFVWSVTKRELSQSRSKGSEARVCNRAC
jgi:hypothetical protein